MRDAEPVPRRSWWDYWLTQLTDEQRQAAVDLRDRFAALDAREPEDWAGSEIREGIPQLARFLVLRDLWAEAVDGWAQPEALESVPAAQRLLAAGADRADLVRAMRAAAYEAAFAVLNRVDEGSDRDAPDDCPHWQLAEIGPGGEPTGRFVSGLHEDFLGMEPSGREGADLWE
jgi:hypothetical protein